MRRFFSIITIYFYFFTWCSILNANAFVFAAGMEEVVYRGGEYVSPFKSRLPERREIEDVKVLMREEIGELPEFNLQGIIWGGDFPQAILNSLVVKEGDKVNEAEIVKIEKGKVELLYESKIFVLTTGSVVDDEGSSFE